MRAFGLSLGPVRPVRNLSKLLQSQNSYLGRQVEIVEILFYVGGEALIGDVVMTANHIRLTSRHH